MRTSRFYIALNKYFDIRRQDATIARQPRRRYQRVPGLAVGKTAEKHCAGFQRAGGDGMTATAWRRAAASPNLFGNWCYTLGDE
jgi:hypothetical protein